MFKYNKLRSFGIVEAIIGAMILIIVLAAAVTLASNSSKSTELNSSYEEARNISDLILERIQLIKADGRIYFDSVSRGDGDEMISIDCFDAEKRSESTCANLDTASGSLGEFPYIGIDEYDSEDYGFIPADWLNNPAFGENHFRFKVSVEQPIKCETSGTVSIEPNKCRHLSVDVRWREASGEKNFKQKIYITDWER